MNTFNAKILFLSIFFLLCLFLFVFFHNYFGKQVIVAPVENTFIQNTSSSTLLTTTNEERLNATTSTVFATSSETIPLPKSAFQRIVSSWKTIDIQGRIFATTTEIYFLAYAEEIGQVQVHIFQDPSEQNRALAEAELLRVLGMQKEDVCRLNYSVTRKTWSSQYRVQEIGLSFCPGSVDLSKESNSTLP